MSEKSIWIVRAGKNGENERFALENNCMVISWRDLAYDIRDKTVDELREIGRGLNISDRALGHWSWQPYRFINEIQIGDMVFLPSKLDSSYVAIGEVTGEYEYHAEAEAGTKHRRAVSWKNKEFLKSDLPDDIRRSLTSLLTVSKVKKENAAARVQAVLDSGGNPLVEVLAGVSATEDEDEIDQQQLATDNIKQHIREAFPGYEMQELIKAILVAMGFHCLVPSRGPDGGVDILAAGGELGLSSPYICVQVKNAGKIGDPALRDLHGTMRNKAEKGIFVSWGGFANEEKLRLEYFNDIRLWNSDDVLKRIYKYYDKFPLEIKDKLRLRQIWIIDPEEI